MARTPSITKFTNSLKDFLINAMSNKVSDAKALNQRYNNMKVFMDPSMIDEPHFYVSLGISEVCYALEGTIKLDGGVGLEDVYIKRWAERHNIHTELEKYYKNLKNAIRKESMLSDEQRKEEGEREKKFILARASSEDDEDLKVDMTSTGIDKQKRFAAEERNRKRLFYFKKDIVQKEDNNREKQEDKDQKDS